jgi:invasion protein IalB
MLVLSRRLSIAALIAAGATIVPLVSAQADDPTLQGAFGAWSAFSNGTGDGKVCYALAQPASKQPAKIKRDPVYFLINDWPKRGAKSEPEVVPGYQYKDNSKVTVQVGSDKFDFFTKNEDGVGGAWVEQQPDEVRLIEAMKSGQQIIVTGISKRGTMTHDTYSLKGLSDALDKIHATCGMP